MDGLKFFFHDSRGRKQIKPEDPQYLFLEPYEAVVLRHSFTKDGLETPETKISKQTIDPKYLEVKVRPTKDKMLSRINDFKYIDTNPNESFTITFNSDDEELFVDVLYRSITDKRLKVRISTLTTASSDFFENESTITDGPDAYVKLVDLQIKYDAVYFNYIYRRKGMLKKYVGKVSYEQLGYIFKDRLFNPDHIDSGFPRASIEDAITEDGWKIDITNKMIYKEDRGRKLEMLDEHLANLIKTKGRRTEILGLLKTQDEQVSKHFLRLTAQNYLQDCDRVCGLPDTTPTTIIDLRE